MTLQGAYTNSIAADEKITINGNCTITADVPIDYANNKEVIITGYGTLTLVSTVKRQPCIGVKTRTGMSYGRWESSTEVNVCQKIIIDGVKVICESKTPNFSLGEYNKESYPEIVCINGGELVCPETKGKRYLKTYAFPSEGSTKVSGDPVYVIGEENLFSESDLRLIHQLPTNLQKIVSYHCSEKALKCAIELLNLNSECDVTPLLTGDYESNLMIGRTMCVLGMPIGLFSFREFYFEMNKTEFLREKYNKSADVEPCATVVSIVKELYGEDLESLSDWDYEVIYEMIPTYFYNFEGSKHKENALNFMQLYGAGNTQIEKLTSF